MNIVIESQSFWLMYKANCCTVCHIDDDGVSSDLPLMGCCGTAGTCYSRCGLPSSVAEAVFVCQQGDALNLTLLSGSSRCWRSAIVHQFATVQV